MGVGRAGLQAPIVKQTTRDNQLKLNSHIARKQKAWTNTDSCSAGIEGIGQGKWCQRPALPNLREWEKIVYDNYLETLMY